MLAYMKRKYGKVLVCILALLSCVVSLKAMQLANVPVLESAPSVLELSDCGHVFWRSAVHLEGFTEFIHGRSPKWGSELCLAATKEALYVQIRGKVEAGSRRVASESRRDGRVYHDECLELALALPNAPEGEYFQFTLNANNVLYDAYKVDSSWNSSVETTVCAGNELWGATLRIPFADLGLKAVQDDSFP